MTDRLTKDEAAARLGVSTRTVDRRIARGELQIEREADGKRRIMVLLNTDAANLSDTILDTSDTLSDRHGEVSDTTGDTSDILSDTVSPEDHGTYRKNGASPANTEMSGEYLAEQLLTSRHELELEQERNRGLEELVEHLKEQVVIEQARYSEIYADMKSGALALPAPKSRPWWKFWGARTE